MQTVTTIVSTLRSRSSRLLCSLSRARGAANPLVLALMDASYRLLYSSKAPSALPRLGHLPVCLCLA
jgi:hypothetical protein